MKVSDFDYELPEELIAQHPLEKRDESRLMILDRENKKLSHKVFKDIIDYLNPGDCLVVNNTKVLPARLYGKKINTKDNVGALEKEPPVSDADSPLVKGADFKFGADVEFLLLKNLGEDFWEVTVRPGKKLKEGNRVAFGIDEDNVGNVALVVPAPKEIPLQAEIVEVLENRQQKSKIHI